MSTELNNLDPQQERNTSLLDSDFADAPSLTPQPQPQRADVDQLASDIRAGIEAAGLDPSQMTPDSYEQFADLIRSQWLERKQAEAAQQFLLNHPSDYLPTPQNGAAIERTLSELGLDPTDPRSLEVAFNTARARGQISGPEPQRKPSAPSGLSDRVGVRVPVTPAYRDAEQLSKQLDAMSLDDARAAMIRLMQEQGGEGLRRR